MTKRSERVRELDHATRIAIVERDKEKCIVCGSPANAVHEIISKSAWGTRGLEICYSEKNRCCICARCHSKAQGNQEWTGCLLQIMVHKYGYQYHERQFARYLK